MKTSCGRASMRRLMRNGTMIYKIKVLEKSGYPELYENARTRLKSTMYHNIITINSILQSLHNSSTNPFYAFQVHHIHHLCLTHQNTTVTHLALAQSLHRLFDSLLGQGEGHGGWDDLLFSSKLDQSPEAVPRCNKRSLDTDALDVHVQKRDGRGCEVDGQRVD